MGALRHDAINRVERLFRAGICAYVPAMRAIVLRKKVVGRLVENPVNGAITSANGLVIALFNAQNVLRK